MESQRLPEGLLDKVRLIERYLSREISGEEKEVLDSWLHESPAHQAFFESVTDKAKLQEKLQQFFVAKAMTTEARASANELVFGSQTPVRSLRSRWKQWAAVAAILILVTSGAYLWFNQREPLTVAQTGEKQKPASMDVAPGKYKARLTLGDGSTITLDSAAAGKLAQQGNTEVLNKKGGLTYQPGTTAGETTVYNTLTTAKGEIYNLQLSDGSRIWLNSASSVRYPVAFAGKERKVAITGEAYFEVAHLDNSMPFKVVVNDMEVRVLGTHFNINAFKDEAKIRTTLLEGSVAVTPAGSANTVILKPGEQAGMDNLGNIKIDKEVDLQEVMAWKNGKFVFRNTNIQLIMRQMERWYDLDSATFTNEEVRKWEFTGEISRYNKASKVLQLLEETGGGKFEISGKKILISK